MFPATSSFAARLDVPMPTLPLLVTVIWSTQASLEFRVVKTMLAWA
jgi:hypothetical protein